MNNWSVYLLRSGTRTYIGSTTDVVRRLRQHNGELRGGARATRGKPWFLVCWISGFENRSAACRWERILKCRARGLEKRMEVFSRLAVDGKCPPGSREYSVPGNLYYYAIEWRAT